MNIYFVPFGAAMPEDIILYNLSEEEKETLILNSKGQVSFEYKKSFYQLPGGRWTYTLREALELIKFYLLEEKKDLEKRIEKIEESLKLI